MRSCRRQRRTAARACRGGAGRRRRRRSGPRGHDARHRSRSRARRAGSRSAPAELISEQARAVLVENASGWVVERVLLADLEQRPPVASLVVAHQRSPCRRRAGRCERRPHVEARRRRRNRRSPGSRRPSSARRSSSSSSVDVVQLRVVPVQADEDPLRGSACRRARRAPGRPRTASGLACDPTRGRRRRGASSRRRPRPAGRGCAGCRGPRRTHGCPGRGRR